MALPVVLAIAQTLLPMIFGTIDKAVPDKDKAADLKAQMQMALLNMDASATKAASDIIVAEAQGESWLQRNWRPTLMIVFTIVVANNYILAPYVQAMFDPGTAVHLPLPDRMWDLMTIGVGGYIAGRSGEKIVERLNLGGQKNGN